MPRVPCRCGLGERADAARGTDPGAHREVLRGLDGLQRHDLREPDADDGRVRSPVLAPRMRGVCRVRGGLSLGFALLLR